MKHLEATLIVTGRVEKTEPCGNIVTGFFFLSCKLISLLRFKIQNSCLVSKVVLSNPPERKNLILTKLLWKNKNNFSKLFYLRSKQNCSTAAESSFQRLMVTDIY